MTDVVLVRNEAGDAWIGFEEDGYFVPVAGIAVARIAHYTERAASLAERLESGDGAAEEAVESLPIAVRSKTAKTTTGKAGA